MRPGAAAAAPVPLPRPPGDEISQPQRFGLRTDVSLSKQRAASSTMPQMTDNPLYEGLSEDVRATSLGRCAGVNSRTSEQRAQDGRMPLSRHSLDESRVASKQSRRRQSWSLSSRDYEGMWRTVQENVFKSSSRNPVSALEDFNQFRRKLADLKQAKSEMSAPPPTPRALTPSGSIRSSNVGSVSTRSLNLPTTRPTSPLQRLSVISSRKGASGLNSQRDFSHRGGQLPPSVHKFALSMRAEGLFKLPSPASISPFTGDPHSSPARPHPGANSGSNPPGSTAAAPDSRSRFCTRGRGVAVEEKKLTRLAISNKNEQSFSGGRSPRYAKTRKGAGAGQGRSRVPTCVSNEVESFMNICSPRTFAALHTFSPKPPKQAPRRQQQQGPDNITEKISAASSGGLIATGSKASCIHIPRPVCYGAHILE